MSSIEVDRVLASQDGRGAPPFCPDLSLVLCCYLDADHLKRNTLSLLHYLSLSKKSFELVFVNDASPDATAEVIQDLAIELKDKGVAFQVVSHPTNRGRGAAVRSGFACAKGRVVGFIDVDLEHLPDAMIIAVDRINLGEADAIVGQRVYAINRTNPLRALTSVVYKTLVQSVLKLPVSDTEAGFKFFNREKILPVLARAQNDGWFWDTEIVHRAAEAGLRVVEHPIVFQRNPNKVSTVRVVRDSWVYLRTLFAYRMGLRRP